eukprot:5034440-Amphidinium_carterae.1
MPRPSSSRHHVEGHDSYVRHKGSDAPCTVSCEYAPVPPNPEQFKQWVVDQFGILALRSPKPN